MPVTADQVGKLYDILIATRDGSALSCVDHNGQTQQVSQVAYMLSTTKPSSEATEIQRRDQLVQLASAQMIDRDFDAYPQVAQGDWSDGQGQRVFSGQGEALGTVSNKSTRYWDGLGILWPITDYLPQQPVTASPDQAEGGARMKTAGQGVTGGNSIFQSGNQAYAYAYMQNSAPQHNIIVLQTTATHKIDPAPDSVNGSPAVGNLDYVLGGGWLWVVSTDGANVHVNQYADGAPPTVVNSGTIAGGTIGNGVPALRVAFGRVANKTYLAVLYLASTSMPTVQLFDITGSPIFNSSVPIPVGELNQQSSIQQIDFLGDNLVIAGSLGSSTFIEQYNIPSQTHTTLAQIPNTNTVYFCSIAGSLFVLAVNFTNNATGDTVDMYLLQAGNLQHIGPVQVQATTQSASNVVCGEAEPVVIGPYAVFPIYYDPVGTLTGRIAIFAYDVLRGRLFKVADVGTFERFIGSQHGRRCAIVGPATHGTPIGFLNAQWMIGVPALSNLGSASDVTNAQFVMIGVSTGAFQPFLQQGVQITSSLIDFTSAQNKLYRQVVADFTPLPNDAAITVQLDCWFDQDPGNLSAVPDFSTGSIAGGVSNVGLSQVKLVTNRIARKVVYRITTTGPSALFNPAVKVISVKVQVATGWSLHYFLDIARNAQCNDNATYCFDNQRPIDDFSAYAFLKQLWRLKGGECAVTLPTGETYNALLQLISAENVKHVTQSGLSDTPTVRSVILELKLREDI